MLCTLSHELGHARSWLHGDRTDAYVVAHQAFRASDPSQLSEAEKRHILDEEMRAWRNGFEIAQEVGFADGDAFLREAERALRYYFDALKLPPEELTLDVHST
jgi:hypothetical protein